MGIEKLLPSDSPENSPERREELLAGSVSGPMSELLGMYDPATIDIFNSKVLERHGIEPRVLDSLDDTVARAYMEDFVYPLLDADETHNPGLQDLLADEAADELNRLVEIKNGGRAAA